MEIARIDLENNEAVLRWKNKETVFSVSLGGLGPGYEQAIQNYLFDIFMYLHDNKIDTKILVDIDKHFTPKYDEICDLVIKEFNHNDLTGAMYEVARCTAYQFHNYGYSHMMKIAPKDRIIQVNKTN